MNIVAILISLLALGFTSYSFWWMNWRKGSLEVSNIRTFAAVASSNTFLIQLPLIFFNPGALPILIENLRLTFPDRGDKYTALFFSATVDALASGHGRTFATPFAIHKGEALLKICEFQRSRSGFSFEAINYEINIEALLSGESEWKVVKNIQLKVRNSQIKNLNSMLAAYDNEPQRSQP